MSEPEVITTGRHLRFVHRDGWEYVDRTTAWAVVLIIPVTDDGNVIFVEQYRPPVERRCIELPAGLVGDDAPEESIEAAARRELFEETGYEAATMEELFRGVPSAGLTSEEITFFLARGLKKTGAGGGDASEDITVHAVPIDRVETWLMEQAAAGFGIDAKVFSALYFARTPHERA